ncbi:hypothetical protein K1719_003074 [Acacia pycnantha]|nr:hypothetical protein K1719_003074 [Acacia pycnantha]
MDDYMEALIGGPWVISDAYLSVARWRPEFSPKNERINSVVAWVRFPDLPAPLFDKKFLLNLGNSIGKAIRLDVHTAQRMMGRKINEEGMVVDGVEATNKNEGDKEGDKGRWKTVQRFRRPRRQESDYQNKQSGSRFSVLQEEQGEEVLERGEVLGQGKGPRNVFVEKEQSRSAPIKLNKQGKNEGTRGLTKDNNLSKPRSKGRAVHETSKKEDKQERGSQAVSKLEKGRKQLAEINLEQENTMDVPVSNLKVHAWQEVHMTDKENLYPGEDFGISACKETTGFKVLQAVGAEMIPSDDIGMSIGEVCPTTNLAV